MLFRTVILLLLLTVGLQSPHWAAAVAKPSVCTGCCVDATTGRKHCPNCPPACVGKCACFAPAEPIGMLPMQLVIFSAEVILAPPRDDGHLAARTDDPLVPPPKPDWKKSPSAARRVA